MKRIGHLGARHREAGFTIIELTIASLVFSVVLVVLTTGIVSFSRSYYRGVNMSTTQSTARAAIDAVSQSLQFSANDPTLPKQLGTSNNWYMCNGDKLYMYTIGKKFDVENMAAPGNWGLYEMTASSGCVPFDTGIPSPAAARSSLELLGKNLRLAYMSVQPTPVPNTWSITITVAYGDADLLCKRSIAGVAQGSCERTAPPFAVDAIVAGDTPTDVACKTQAGSQFCAVSSLTTTVQKRISTGS